MGPHRTVVRELRANDIVECSENDKVGTINTTMMVVVVVVIALRKISNNAIVMRDEIKHSENRYPFSQFPISKCAPGLS